MKSSNRKETVEFLIGNLEKLPNREKCRELSVEELLSYTERIDFIPLFNYLDKNISLFLTLDEISYLKFQLVIYIILATTEGGSISNCELYNIHKTDVCSHINDILVAFQKAPFWDEINSISPEAFLEYAKSNEPDFF